MIQQQSAGLLIVMIITLGEAITFGTLPPLPTTGTLYTILYYMFILLYYIGVRLYLSYENRVIPNYFMVRGSQFYDSDQNGDGQNDGIWCQSSLNESMIGAWYLPNGSPVPTQSGATPLESYNTNVIGQVGLLRRAGLASFEGLYSCIILNEEEVNQSLYVAVYRVGTFANSGE